MCNKITYLTKEAATTHAHFIQNDGKDRRDHKITAKARPKYHPYQCIKCGNWHLTTLAKSVSKRFPKNSIWN